MTVDSAKVMRLTRRFNASPERVFDAWLDPQLTRQWLFASPVDERYDAEIDPRVGGTYTITARRDGTDYTASGEYLEIDRPHRLVMTFAMPQFSPNCDRLTVEIAPDGTGCILTLTQEGIDIANELRAIPAGEVGGTEQGWRDMFDALAASLS